MAGACRLRSSPRYAFYRYSMRYQLPLLSRYLQVSSISLLMMPTLAYTRLRHDTASLVLLHLAVVSPRSRRQPSRSTVLSRSPSTSSSGYEPNSNSNSNSSISISTRPPSWNRNPCVNVELSAHAHAYTCTQVGAIIAQSQDHTMFRFTGPALGIALFFLISRCFPIRGLPVVVRCTVQRLVRTGANSLTISTRILSLSRSHSWLMIGDLVAYAHVRRGVHDGCSLSASHRQVDYSCWTWHHWCRCRTSLSHPIESTSASI